MVMTEAMWTLADAATNGTENGTTTGFVDWVVGFSLMIFGIGLGLWFSANLIRALRHLSPIGSADLFKSLVTFLVSGAVASAVEALGSSIGNGALAFSMYLAGIGIGLMISWKGLQSTIQSTLNQDVRLLGATKYFGTGGRPPFDAEVFVYVTNYGVEQASLVFELPKDEVLQRFENGATQFAKLKEAESDENLVELMIQAMLGTPVTDLARSFKLTVAEVTSHIARMYSILSG